MRVSPTPPDMFEAVANVGLSGRGVRPRLRAQSHDRVRSGSRRLRPRAEWRAPRGSPGPGARIPARSGLGGLPRAGWPGRPSLRGIAVRSRRVRVRRALRRERLLRALAEPGAKLEPVAYRPFRPHARPAMSSPSDIDTATKAAEAGRR